MARGLGVAVLLASAEQNPGPNRRAKGGRERGAASARRVAYWSLQGFPASRFRDERLERCVGSTSETATSSALSSRPDRCSCARLAIPRARQGWPSEVHHSQFGRGSGHAKCLVFRQPVGQVYTFGGLAEIAVTGYKTIGCMAAIGSTTDSVGKSVIFSLHICWLPLSTANP